MEGLEQLGFGFDVCGVCMRVERALGQVDRLID